MLQLRKAQRKQAKLRIGLSAPSGFGKTYSALLLAYGITGDWSKIALIDTENGSGELYSHLGDYNALPLEAPYSPERYIEAIKVCEQAGMEAIIIDSISHEWEGTGGCLEIQEQLGGKYQDWAKVTPRHKAFIDAILTSKCHVLTTVRRKQDYEMVKDGNKTSVVKAGLKEITRDGFEYELTLNLEIINDKHLTKASKDRTGLFSGKPEFVITVETGKQLKEWAETGVDVLQLALREVEACTDVECTTRVWHKYENLKTVDAFKSAVAEKGKSLKAAATTEPTPENGMPEEEAREAGAADFKKQVAQNIIDENSTAATPEQVERIKELLNDDVISPEELEKGMVNLEKGYTIAKAGKVLEKLEKLVDDRKKATANA